MTIWRMNVGDGVPAPVDLNAGGEDVLIARPDAEVEVRALPQGGAAFVSALGDGRTVLAATKAAFATDNRFDLAANLAGLLQAQAIVGLERTSVVSGKSVSVGDDFGGRRIIKKKNTKRNNL